MAAVANQQQPKTPSKTPQKATGKVKQQVQEPVDDAASQGQSEIESTADDAQSTAEGTVDNDDEEEGDEEEQSKPPAQEKQQSQVDDDAAAKGDEKTEAAEGDSEEEQKKKQDAELANKISNLIGTCLDQVKPTLKMIVEALDKGDRERQNDELDEQKLVDHVKPLIQQASDTLGQCHGGIKALDPDGTLGKRAQSNAAERKATPEEYRLSDQLKELTSEVEKTIDESKRRIQDMPKAKKDLGPMLDMLKDPLLQILGAVGLLLNGVLGLLGNLLGGLGLNGIVDTIKGSLGLDKIMKSFGF